MQSLRIKQFFFTIFLLNIAVVILAEAQLKVRIAGSQKEWGGADKRDIKAVCVSSASEILKELQEKKVEPIVVIPSKEGPMVLHKRSATGELRVLIDVKGNQWAQLAYQFAHEFGHIITNFRENHKVNLWFEEVLCETASLYALRRMGETWKVNPPYEGWKSYAKHLTGYANRYIEKSQLPEGKSLAEWFRENEAYFRKNPTDRHKNRIIAAQLLPLFELSPSGWDALRSINSWPTKSAHNFDGLVKLWHEKSPKRHKEFVLKIANRFGIDITR